MAYISTNLSEIKLATKQEVQAKQDVLVSGVNVKTVNSQSLLGSGNINIDSLPAQAGQSGKYLTTDGSAASWATLTLPSDMVGATASTAGAHGLVPAPAAGDQGKFLKGDGTWANLDTTHTMTATIVGDNTTTDFVINHAFNSTDLLIQIIDLSDNQTVQTDVERTSSSSVTISFASAPITTDRYRVLIYGLDSIPIPSGEEVAY